jgi:anthranilate phosphoribosyltransferase
MEAEMIREAIKKLIEGQSLAADEASTVMDEIMAGEATPAQFGAFVTALRLKGETADEIVGLARVMRARAVPVTTARPVVDTCGTGGDSAGTFNISTAAAFVAASAGLSVAKHGNRAMSSQCGSADVLEALGVRIDLDAAQVGLCLQEVGIGFMFAPLFHPAMKYAAAPRREIGIRTVFNILGPLTNPAGAGAQVIGVADGSLGGKIATVLKGLGSRHALVVHGDDGLDEISVCQSSQVWELKDGTIKSYNIAPEDFGLSRAAEGSLSGGNATTNAALLRAVFEGTTGPRRDAVLLNAAAALVAGDSAASLKEGVALTRKALDSGAALAKLEELIEFGGCL